MIKVLIVEDCEEIIEIENQIIKQAYSNVIIKTTNSNNQAYKILKKFIPNLIISDINRPGGDGFEFISKLKEIEALKFVPKIVVSSQCFDEKNELNLYRAGYNTVLAKPFSQKEFIDKFNVLVPSDKSRDNILLSLKREDKSLDYKEILNLNTNDDKASFAKDVISMSNAGGGTIIVGVAEPIKGIFEYVGVSEKLQSILEITNLNRMLRNYTDPVVTVNVRKVHDFLLEFLFIEVPSADEVPILAKKNNENIKLFQGRIYLRNNSAECKEITDYNELRKFLNRFIIKK